MRPPGFRWFPLESAVAPPVGGKTRSELSGLRLQEGGLKNIRGFTVIDLIVALIMLAVLATIIIPRALKPSPQLRVDLAARALTRDLETIRMRAIAAKRHVRVRFDQTGDYYTAFMDMTPGRLGVVAETADEVHGTRLAARGSVGDVPVVRLPKGVVFGSGAALSGPRGADAADAIALSDDQVEFDARGMVAPPGVGGVVYLVHEDDETAVAAVTISGAGAFRVWRYQVGIWRK